MWFCFTVTGAVSALIIIVSLWEKFQTNPTITGTYRYSTYIYFESKWFVIFIFIGLDTDFHNQQVIFPTIGVCPIVPYDENRTQEIAYSTLGYFCFLLMYISYLTSDNHFRAYDPDVAIKIEPVLQMLTILSYTNIIQVAKQRSKLSNPDVKKLGKFPLRTLAFMVFKHIFR